MYLTIVVFDVIVKLTKICKWCQEYSELANLDDLFVAQWSALKALEEEVSSSIPGTINLGNEFFKMYCHLIGLDSITLS